ncbi:MAG TPA: hypothetical protein VEO54_09565 [Thermoanaerobaculia bacterium]|nr:hypothetical protein [Thermoanaerobaculia bacterium]
MRCASTVSTPATAATGETATAFTINGCYSGAQCFSADSELSLASEYRIASVEITHGTDAEVQVAEQKTAQPQTARVAEARK